MFNDIKTREVVVDIEGWINKAKSDPLKYTERQATEIVLATLGSTEPYCRKFFLKGGLLMGIVYDSPRQTADIDYSTTLDPTPDLANKLENKLNQAFPSVAANLGYVDIICKVQTIKHQPKVNGFEHARSPGYKITIGYAKRGEPQEKRLLRKEAATVLHIDISFKEPIGGMQIVKLKGSSGEFQAYSLEDIIAEKFRALLQQEIRKRYRRQDIYDLVILLEKFSLDDTEKEQLLKLIHTKCKARGIAPKINSLESVEIVRRAKSEWDTLRLELGDIPDFDYSFSIVNQFYRSLPW